MESRLITIEPVEGFAPAIGRSLALLEDVRLRLKLYINGLTTDQLSWHPQPNVESIGTLLLHLAAIEHSYIQEDILRKPMGEEWKIAFPIRFGIPQVSGEPLAFYEHKLDEVRAATRAVLADLTDRDLQRVVEPLDPGDPDADPVEYSIEWILYHLAEHEAHHKGQIAVMKRLLPVAARVAS